jgi:uncharacterized membrane protein YkvA (DUF1232 family)
MKNFTLSSIYQWYRGLLQNPQYRWWAVAATLVYVVSPIDFLPEVFPIVGILDDTVLIGMLVSEMAQIAKTQLQAQNERRRTATGQAPIEVSATTLDTLETV